MAIIHLTKDNFENEALKSKEPVLIDFWATWCGPCRMLSPIIEEAETEISAQGLGKVGKVNVDEQPEIAEKYGVMTIPTLIMLKDGEPVETVVGLRQKDAIMQMFQKIKAAAN